MLLIASSMSILNTLQRAGTLVRASLIRKLDSARTITFSRTHCSEEENTSEGDSLAAETPKVACVPIVSVETSIKYMNSDAYKQTYGDDPVWKMYRRNFKGQIPPRKTRKTCIRGGQISTGSPCPICRDEYLVFDHRNVKLLEQFINKYNGSVLSYSKTNICQRRHKQLLIALAKAKDYGTITFDLPIRQYDYSEWKPSNN
ncbi:PREDICTED: 28S ribosomal protein S18b, mitochondrial isoform X2 [Trachymyrmex septentrionalis]|uniref:28S ribosomal protein S18b, mitochondrial isoform X2 n=1 Tax=Trachymyrmex septentrionalis TaxID=34720 RepID=UPI00084F2C49|nr:PREDICTED: 28S ribosomal protein S18b, mitochondrial isoform X2 [Trachymyrmex septentrionalis]